MLDSRHVMQIVHLLANLVVETPALVHQEVELRAYLGKINKNLRALNHARIDHADKLLVPVVKMGRHLVLLFLQVCPGMMHEKAGLQLAMLESVLLHGIGDAPDAVELSKEIKLAR